MGAETSALDVPPHVLDYLRGQKTMTLATASPTGVPRATTLTYVNDGPMFYVWTHPESTVARHADQNPIVSFAIDEYAADWRETNGVQATGECRVLLDPVEIERAVALFEEKFPSLSSASASNISFFRITPTDLQFIEGAGRGEDADQSLGLEYQRDVVYSVFRDLPPSEVATIAGRLHTVHVDAGEVVVRQGAPADKFFIIVDGKVDVLREDRGETRKLNEMGRGEFFGEMAILRDSPRTATVQATEPTTLLAMERDTFRSLVAQSLGTTQAFDELIHKRLYGLVAGGR